LLLLDYIYVMYGQGSLKKESREWFHKWPCQRNYYSIHHLKSRPLHSITTWKIHIRGQQWDRNTMPIVIKLELARRVDPRRWLDRSVGWTGPSLFQMRFFSYTPLFSYFLSWLLTPFKVHYINIRKIFFFNVGFKTLYYIYFMFLRKKIIFSI